MQKGEIKGLEGSRGATSLDAGEDGGIFWGGEGRRGRVGVWETHFVGG